MEEVIKKSDGQFKDILDDLVDYKKHVSKKDPLIKELSRPKPNNSNTKSPASINSSTYSSAASSASDSSTHSSSSSSSSTSSASSSKSSSPSQSQVGNQNGKNQAEYGKLEIAKMEDLGKTAKILEHRLPSVLRTIPVVVATSNPSYVSHFPLTNNNKKSNTEEYNNTTSSNSNININNDNDSSSNANLNIPAQKYATNGCSSSQLNGNGLATTSSAIISAGSSWKTINAKRDKRRKKPVERKILAKEIPGHRGDLTVEELTKFIESGTNGTSYSGNNKNSKSKPQNSSNGISSNSNQGNIGGNNNNNNNNTNSTTNNSINIYNNGAKKNESQQINSKPAQTSNKLSNPAPNQLKNPPQPNINQQPTTMAQSEQTQQAQQLKQQPTINEQSRENQLQKNTTKPSQQAQQQPKHATNNAMKQPQRRIQQSIMGPPPAQQPEQQQAAQNSQLDKFQNESCQDQTQHAAVTFAEHIQVCEEDARQYTFGFFEEQPASQVQQTKQTLINHNSHVNNTRKQTSQPLQNEQKQNKPKQSKASPNSEENCYKYNDNFDAHNFNYEQILKFISSAWESTQIQVLTASQKH